MQPHRHTRFLKPQERGILVDPRWVGLSETQTEDKVMGYIYD